MRAHDKSKLRLGACSGKTMMLAWSSTTWEPKNHTAVYVNACVSMVNRNHVPSKNNFNCSLLARLWTRRPKRPVSAMADPATSLN
ncbi:hypothetical protein G6F70_002270 [Rhizopus microsporus]|nr:hypothetical protein G6F71_005389 [Rhizopus microsporus]KAG1202429.1 hypothetical protein G6F70_002270 [Rhizopus microsporus]KAG1209143.1 hypothetical protein G6F69_006605 [Rhizopus microsporus]KAG1235402.1 hypothetical protein G6F67_002782 [Rhizopus microsporus]KAG1264449.1 hypothetical protein G6F68_004338 [Rhizopus microsporus]